MPVRHESRVRAYVRRGRPVRAHTRLPPLYTLDRRIYGFGPTPPGYYLLPELHNLRLDEARRIKTRYEGLSADYFEINPQHAYLGGTWIVGRGKLALHPAGKFEH